MNELITEIQFNYAAKGLDRYIGDLYCKVLTWRLFSVGWLGTRELKSGRSRG